MQVMGWSTMPYLYPPSTICVFGHFAAAWLVKDASVDAPAESPPARKPAILAAAIVSLDKNGLIRRGNDGRLRWEGTTGTACSDSGLWHSLK